MRRKHKLVELNGVMALALSGLCGCQRPAPPPATSSVQGAWQNRESQSHASTKYRERLAPSPSLLAPRAAAEIDSMSDEDVLAVVNGRPIAKSRMVELLLRSHGAGLLEQLVGLEAAMEYATRQNISVSRSEIDREYELALSRLTDPLASVVEGVGDRAAGERALEAVLSERNISREEFLVTLRRNAYLRKCVQSAETFSEDDIRAEADRLYGERVLVRHIQLGSSADLARAQERLEAGEEFGEVAARLSANTASARQKGLLDPFSANDDRVPAPFRQAAFALKAGEEPRVVRIGEWHHLLILEQRIPAERYDLTVVRVEVERSLRDRVTEEQMRELFERLMRDAQVDIRDESLKQDYMKRLGP